MINLQRRYNRYGDMYAHGKEANSSVFINICYPTNEDYNYFVPEIC